MQKILKKSEKISKKCLTFRTMYGIIKIQRRGTPHRTKGSRTMKTKTVVMYQIRVETVMSSCPAYMWFEDMNLPSLWETREEAEKVAEMLRSHTNEIIRVSQFYKKVKSN